MLVPVVFGGPAGPVTTTFIQGALNNSALSSYTFSISGWATSGTRIIGVGAFAGSQLNLSSVTIDGISASIIGSELVFQQMSLGLFAAPATVNTTANVVVALSGTGIRCAVSAWNVQNLSSYTPTQMPQTSTGGSGTRSVSINVQAGGAAFACCYDRGNGTVTWGGLTEDYVTQASSFGNHHASFGQNDFASPQTGLSVSVSVASTSALLVASMR